MTCLFLLIITWDFLDSLFFLGNAILKMDYGSVVWTEEKNDDRLRLLCIFAESRSVVASLQSGESDGAVKSEGRVRHQWIIYSGLWQQRAQRNNSWCFCGLTQLTSCLTGYTLRSLHPALPVPFLYAYTGTHTHALFLNYHRLCQATTE